jgi:hypothetical protein
MISDEMEIFRERVKQIIDKDIYRNLGENYPVVIPDGRKKYSWKER